jgi:hypothetical protein
MMSDQNVEIFFYYIPFSRPNKNKEVVYKRFNKKKSYIKNLIKKNYIYFGKIIDQILLF